MNDSIVIPNKSHFKQNEVCGLTGVKPYVLRFWESEFDEISPITGSNGQKLYEHNDIEAILLIKKLLFENKLKIEQARLEIKKPEYQMLLGLEDNSPFTPTYLKDNSSDEEEESMELTPIARRRGFGDEEVQKLVQAKEMLRGLVESTQSLKERHNWN